MVNVGALVLLDALVLLAGLGVGRVWLVDVVVLVAGVVVVVVVVVVGVVVVEAEVVVVVVVVVVVGFGASLALAAAALAWAWAKVIVGLGFGGMLFVMSRSWCVRLYLGAVLGVGRRGAVNIDNRLIDYCNGELFGSFFIWMVLFGSGCDMVKLWRGVGMEPLVSVKERGEIGEGDESDDDDDGDDDADDDVMMMMI